MTSDSARSRAAASTYRQVLFESAPPLKIVHMMYEGALRFLDQAEQSDPAGDAAAFDRNLRRAEDIVCELRFSLEQDQAPELCEDLDALYLFVEQAIQEALVERRAAPIAGARGVLATLLDGWKRIVVPEQVAG